MRFCCNILPLALPTCWRLVPGDATPVSIAWLDAPHRRNAHSTEWEQTTKLTSDSVLYPHVRSGWPAASALLPHPAWLLPPPPLRLLLAPCRPLGLSLQFHPTVRQHSPPCLPHPNQPPLSRTHVPRGPPPHPPAAGAPACATCVQCRPCCRVCNATRGDQPGRPALELLTPPPLDHRGRGQVVSWSYLQGDPLRVNRETTPFAHPLLLCIVTSKYGSRVHFFVWLFAFAPSLPTSSSTTHLHA